MTVVALLIVLFVFNYAAYAYQIIMVCVKYPAKHINHKENAD